MAINFWDAEFQVNSNLSEPVGQRDFTNQATAVLPDGRIVVTWRGAQNDGDGDPTAFGNGIRARILNQDGSPAGAVFVVNSTTLNGQDAAAITVLTDGRFVVTWHSDENGDGGTGAGAGANLTMRARVFNADGTPSVYNGSDQDFVVNNLANTNDLSPAVAALADGAFVIAWQSPPTFFASHTIEMRLFTNNGPAAGQQSVTVAGTHNESPELATLADGRYVLGWRDNFQNGSDVVARIFNADGTPAAAGGTQFNVASTTAGVQYSLELAALSDGRFVAVWTTDGTGGDDGSSSGIRARVFNADGTADVTVNGGNDFLVNTSIVQEQQRAQVIGLADGGFLISFSSKSDPAGNFENNVLGRLFGADGTPSGSDFVIKEGMGATGGAYTLPNDLVLTPEGRVLSLYMNDPVTSNLIQGRFLDFSATGGTFNGDGSDNVLVGSFTNDTINGLGGADSLFAGDGSDFLNGGAGTDTLKGGSGDDTLNGGADNDTMTGGLGANLFVIAPGDDADTATDFDEGTGLDDRIDLTAFTGIHTRADVLALAAQAGADTVINFGAGDILTLTNVIRDNLADDDFVFAAANSPPTVAAAIADQSVAEDTAWNFQFPAGTFSDPNGDPLSYLATLGNDDPLPGWLSFNPATRTFSGTPPQDFNGSLDVKVTASDGALSASDIFNLTVTPVNDAPVVAGAAVLAAIDEDSGARLITQAELLGNATDVDGPALAAINLAIASGAGSLVDNNNGTWSYTPAVNDDSAVSFSYTVTDGDLSIAATATLDITPVSDADPIQTGTPGDDSFTAQPGTTQINGLGGTDTITFGFRLVDAAVSYLGNAVIIDGPSSQTVLTGFERFAFTDGTVINDDGNFLVDDLFYYARNHDVWNAHVDPDAHYTSHGWHEWRDPSAFFSTALYLSANPDVNAAGVNPLAHFHVHGWQEGRVPSITFDPAQYLAANPDVAAAHVDPLEHFLANGAQEGRQPFAPSELLAANGFDYVFYLNNNPDVAAAHVDPFQHFQTHGWQEGRNPNALFDVNGYLASYTDVAAANINPLDHYNTHGWQEGRDPSVGFDTTSYLAAYADVAAANVNPLSHFLQFGIHEGRVPFADGVWG